MSAVESSASVPVVSTTPRLQRHTYREYAGALELSTIKLEYWAGEILAMAGGTPEHSALASSAMSSIQAKLPSGCRTFNSDLLLKVGDVTVFPDGQVVCGKVERISVGNKTAILNPGLVIEVTSPSTEQYDRGAKLEVYKAIKSLQAVWIVSHKRPRVTVVERYRRGWRETNLGAGEHVTLATPALTVDVDAIYAVLEGL